MKANADVVARLNQVLCTELTSINRFFLHARMYKNWGFERLNEAAYKKSIKDMKQSDKLIERILFLEGLPNLQKLNPLLIGEDTKEMLACDLKFQLAQVAELKDAIALCEQVQDYVSRDLLSEILEYEEDIVDWLETQEYQIENMGLANYLQAQIEEE
ncbi:bacterioferritin [Agaribacterium sp. ZY112]|uniref:bacterioferritin n=1 Tax=Agaribacterium sp. ZY112 TaxID=3233574 RepID=UPI0035243F5B